MEKLYLEANLYGLIEELSKYSSLDEVMKFISSVDYIKRHNYDLIFLKNKYVQENVNNIFTFLMNAYEEKLNQKLIDNTINQTEFDEKLEVFKSSLGTRTRISINKYNNFPNDKNNCYKKVLSKTL